MVDVQGSTYTGHMEQPAKILKKPNQTLVIVPRLGKLTAASRKLYNVVLHTSQQQLLRRTHDEAVDVKGLPVFECRLDEIVRPVERGSSNLFSLAKKYLTELEAVKVDWEAPDQSQGVAWEIMRLIVVPRIERRGQHLWLKWALPERITEALRDPQFFTSIDLERLCDLKSYAAVALYEICARYKTNPRGVTSSNPPEWWVEALSPSSAPIDKATGQRKLREWRKFKAEHVLKAITEINEKTDLLVDLKEQKRGLAVVAVQMSVQVKENLRPQKLSSQVSVDTAAQAVRLGVPLQDVVNAVAGGTSETIVKVAMDRAEARAGRIDLAELENPRAYFRKVLSETKQMVSVEPTPVLSQERGEGAGPHTITQNQLSEEGARIRAAREAVQNLDADEQQRLAKEALRMLIDRGTATPSITKRLAEGKWQAGPAMQAMVDAYLAGSM